MRFRTLAVSVAALALALTGCSGAPSGGGGASGAGPVKLTWWMVTQNADSATDALKQIVSDYQDKNPNVTIDLQFRAVDAHKDALRTAAGSAQAPDIYYNWAGPGLGGELVKSNVSLDLTKYYQQYKWDQRFQPATLKAYTQYGGDQGVPWTQRTEVVYYHKDQFQKAGITAPPTTYAEWEADAQKLKDAGLTPISMGGKDNWHVMRLLDTLVETNCGSALGDQLNTRKVPWSGQPCVNTSFTQLKKWSDNYFNPGFQGLSQTQAAALFTSGKSAMEIEGDWFTQVAIDGGDNINNIGIFPLPTGTDRLYGFTEGQYITKTSAHPDEAAAFLDYLTSPDVEGKYLGTFSAVPVAKDTKASGEQQPINADFAKLVGSTKGYFLNNDQNFSTEITTEYWRLQNGVTAGSVQPADAGGDLQKFISTH